MNWWCMTIIIPCWLLGRGREMRFINTLDSYPFWLVERASHGDVITDDITPVKSVETWACDTQACTCAYILFFIPICIGRGQWLEQLCHITCLRATRKQSPWSCLPEGLGVSWLEGCCVERNHWTIIWIEFWSYWVIQTLDPLDGYF